MVRFHDGEFEEERQSRLRRNWLSCTISCAGSASRVQVNVFALAVPLAFTHPGLASGALDSSPTDVARTRMVAADVTV